MLVTITTTHVPATDLGYLLHKHPERVTSVDLSFGVAHVLYPEASESRCTAALLLDVDPIGLVRDREGEPLAAYVSDRPYVASSFVSVAISRAFGTALGGRSKERQELAERAIALEATVSVVAARGGESLARRLFEPLGWTVEIERIALDELHPEWGEGRALRLALRGTQTVASLLAHLYVLLPVLDDDKHYWVDAAEIDKLLRHGEGWLEAHPERELVTRRYLRHQRSLVRAALERLEPLLDEESEARAAAGEDALERPLSLDARRRAFVRETLREAGVRTVADLGCGEGKLVAELAKERFERVVGVDVNARALEIAGERIAKLPEHARRRVELMTGSLVYRDARLVGLDAATCVEVIEHLEPERLDAFERALFVAARPGLVVVTTPNREHNALFPSLAHGALRHSDHRFEWTRAELEAWARGAAERRGYDVRFAPIGDEHPEHGAPTQAAIFTRKDGAA
ncbi:3' terminal RNA ribose 2'-O-methyltransferase Hen1 [Sandaracinus amylolyticus]|uniref:Small RNA 2'-O-methyltransferase n=1 Tax=Sandaracinus amylolyticus TaxID=927083 RepID=A0A0F6YGF5_9BACT|nr:3' terminal RNA ribose 2'-O-methyltransferase Hen1 [Sandaracinus amylolyticus]AKF04657.1 double-stranded RNA 3'-methylase [Sandaracinus amylolyticus]